MAKAAQQSVQWTRGILSVFEHCLGIIIYRLAAGLPTFPRAANATVRQVKSR